jgi:ADP-heptose:LPS heptosyltransferase
MISKILNIFYRFIYKNKSVERLLRKTINDLLDIKENLLNPYPNNLVQIKNKKIKNILLVSFGGTGDIAIFSSFTTYLKKRYPNSKITVIVHNKKSIIYTATLDKNIDKIIPINFPRFFDFTFVKKTIKEFDYDLFIYTNLYPFLRHLMPNIKFIFMPYFIFRDIPLKVPSPKLKLDFKLIKKKYILLNFDIITFNFSKDYINDKEINYLLDLITNTYKNIVFYYNDFENRIKIKKSNLKIFKGNYKKLVKIASQANLFISMRNGLCDVIAASTKNLPMFVIYPNQIYPGKNGTEFIKIFNMKEINYQNPIEEYVFNKKNTSIKKLFNRISLFIKKYYEK